MRSAVRGLLYPESQAAYSGYSSWRAIAPRGRDEDSLRQFWGPHAEFGVMPVSENETYWYGYVAMPQRSTVADELGAALERFQGWADPVRDVLHRTPAEAVMRHDVHHIPGGVPTYYSGRVVMVGDAAHGFLPTMGQGAATALEDGLCVGRLIGAPVAAGGDLAAALADFDAQRRPRCQSLARRRHRIPAGLRLCRSRSPHRGSHYTCSDPTPPSRPSLITGPTRAHSLHEIPLPGISRATPRGYQKERDNEHNHHVHRDRNDLRALRKLRPGRSLTAAWSHRG
ncbi:hypothetical protein HGQ17_05550 [Nesterenkonia sp. MY13]|uniref:FAD-binding domain-containing protein n=1 Tax=Nesterenkonia sedimenti TaxID=1463632 RepID=A0A7X8TJ80_9MICC|nr:hypothetical protein [Nesterenkonia sedimenti]